MLIKFTAEEQQHIREIQESYQPKIEELHGKINALHDELSHKTSGKEATTKRKERSALLLQLQTLISSREEEVDAYNEKCQRERFATIQAGGADAIIAHAKEQAPAILEYIHRDVGNEYSSLTPAELKKLRIGTAKQGVIYLNADTAASWLKEELRLHREALIDDKERLQELLEAIIEAVENSPYTDSEEITDRTKKPAAVMRFRRSPLADITTYGLMNDKANAQLIQDGGIFQKNADGQLQLLWSVNQAPRKKKQVPVYIALTYTGTEGKLTKKLTAFDIAVYNAVATRFHYWKQENQQKPLYITPQEIWRTMNGKSSKDGKAKPSAAQIKRICDSLDKMRFTRFYMDLREEMRAYNLYIEDERIESGYIDSYLINCSKVEFTTEKGRTVTGYRIAEEPILYTYNNAKKHILYVPYEMLDTSQNTSDSENVTEFRNYLLQQVQLMKNAAEHKGKEKYFERNSIVLLETIYTDTGTQTPEERAAQTSFNSDSAKQTYLRKTRKADRGKIEGILDNWTAKGWIKGYTPVKKGQTVRGYDISI